MAKFAYNNAKNTNIGHISFKLNCDFHLQASYKEDINSCFQLKLADKLANELRELMAVCWENL